MKYDAGYNSFSLSALPDASSLAYFDRYGRTFKNRYENSIAILVKKGAVILETQGKKSTISALEVTRALKACRDRLNHKDVQLRLNTSDTEFFNILLSRFCERGQNKITSEELQRLQSIGACLKR